VWNKNWEEEEGVQNLQRMENKEMERYMEQKRKGRMKLEGKQR